MTHKVLLQSLRYVPLPDGYEDVFADMNKIKSGMFSFFSIILFPVSRSLFYTLSPWMMQGCYLDEREFRLNLFSPTFEFSTWLTISHDFSDELCVEGLKKVYSYVGTIKHRGCRGFAKKEYCDLLLRTRVLDSIVVSVDFDSRSVSVNNKIVEIQAVISCMFNLIENHPVLRTKIAAAECLQRIASSIKIYDAGRDLPDRVFEQQFTSPLRSNGNSDSSNRTTTLLDFLQDLFISMSSQNVDIFNRALIVFCELLCIERFHVPQTSPASRPVTSYFKAFNFLEDIHANGDAQNHLLNSRSVAIIFKALAHLMLPKARHNESSAISSSLPRRGNLHVYVAAKFKDEFWAAYRDNFIVPLLEEERKRVRTLISSLSTSSSKNDDDDDDDDNDGEGKKLHLASLPLSREAKINAINAVDQWLMIWSAKRHPRLWFDQYFDQSSPDQKEAWSRRSTVSTLPTTRLATRSHKHFLSLTLEEQHFEKFISVGQHQTYEQLPWDELIDLWNLVNSSFETPTQTLKRLKKNVEEFLAVAADKNDRCDENETTKDNDNDDGGENAGVDTDSTRSNDSNTFDFDMDKVVVVDENRHQELINGLFVFEGKLHSTRAVLSSFFRNMLLEYLEMRLVMETELKHSTSIPLLFSPKIVNAIFRACTRPIAPSWNLPEIANVFKSTFLADSSSSSSPSSSTVTTTTSVFPRRNYFEQDKDSNRRRGKKRGEKDENTHHDHINDVVVGDLDVLQSVALHSDFEKSLMIEAVCEHVQNMIIAKSLGTSHADAQAATNYARSALERYKNNLKHLVALNEDDHNDHDTNRLILEKYYFKGNEEMKYFDTIFLKKRMKL